MMITDDELWAYAEGLLPAGRTAEIAAIIVNDEEAAARLRDIQLTDAQLREVMAEPYALPEGMQQRLANAYAATAAVNKPQTEKAAIWLKLGGVAAATVLALILIAGRHIHYTNSTGISADGSMLLYLTIAAAAVLLYYAQTIINYYTGKGRPGV